MKNYLFPFVKRPVQEGPCYGDLYERGLAAALDVTCIFFLFNWLLSRIQDRIYAHIDHVKFRALDTKHGYDVMFQQLLEANFIQMWLLNIAVDTLIIGIIYVSFQSIYHTTPGRWVLGLKVVRHGAHEAPISPARYILRYLAYIPSCGFFMIGLLWSSFNRQRRTWHDSIAGTDVISLRPPGWYWQQMKRGYRKLRGKPSVAVEQPVAEPAAEQRHEDGKDPVN